MEKNIVKTILALLNDPSVSMTEINVRWNELISR